jgi:hypothetical protein
MEHFNGRLGGQMKVLPKVDGSPVPLPQKLDEAIVAQLLPHASDHHRTSSGSVQAGSPMRHHQMNPIDKRKAPLKRDVNADESSATSFSILPCGQHFNAD